MGKVILTGKGRRWVARGHPWIYSDDVAAADGSAGELVPVHAPDESPLGWGLFSNSSRIAVRLVTRSAEQPNRAFWLALVGRALEARRAMGLLAPEGACRLVAGDADGLPGFVVDRYRDVLVVQSGTQGSDRMRDFLLELVLEHLDVPIAAVLDRSDSTARRHEDLEPRVEWLRGGARGPIEVHEPGLAYEVDVEQGHKTGHYLDQRDNRIAAAPLGAGGAVLDAFSYDGLFGIRAALAGAERVTCLDQSAEAGERVLRNAERNGVADRVRFERGNAMRDLRRRADEGERYRLVVVDPPAFARSKREAEGAARGYRELNRRAAQLVEPAGTLVSASCSHNVSAAELVGYLAEATFAAGRDAWLTRLAGAAPDHPVRLVLPESEYLKCAFLRLG